MSLSSTNAFTALAHKCWVVLSTHCDTVPWPNVAGLLFTDIKMGRSIPPATVVQRKRAGALPGVRCPLVLHLLNICLIPLADLILPSGLSWSRETASTPTQALWQVASRRHLLWRGPGASESQDRLLISQYLQEILSDYLFFTVHCVVYILLENIKSSASQLTVKPLKSDHFASFLTD